LWHTNEKLYIEDIDKDSISYTLSNNGKGNYINGITLETFIQDNKIDFVDILKIDIEGAEKEIFAKKPQWLTKVGMLIIELHDRKNQGCSRAFFSAIDGYAKNEYYLGDNVFIELNNEKNSSPN
jgi:hypothetical protein